MSGTLGGGAGVGIVDGVVVDVDGGVGIGSVG